MVLYSYTLDKETYKVSVEELPVKETDKMYRIENRGIFPIIYKSQLLKTELPVVGDNWKHMVLITAENLTADEVLKQMMKPMQKERLANNLKKITEELESLEKNFSM